MSGAAPRLGDDEDLQIVLETAMDAVIVMRSDGTVHRWNGAAEAMFGWSAAEAVGRNMGDMIVPPQYREAHARGLKHYLETGEGPVLGQRLELSAMRRDGSEFPIELSIRALKARDAPVFLGFIRDMTAEKAEEERLEAQAQEANLLHRVASLAAESASTDEVLHTCLEAVCELTGWPLGHAFIPDTNNPGRLKPTGIWAGSESGFEAFRETTAKTTLAHGEGLPGHVWKTGEPRWIDDLETHPEFVRIRDAGPLGVRSGFAFPVRAETRIVAILEFFSQVREAPDPRLLLTAQTIGDQAGRVLERRQASDRQELLLAELNHRVKNMLAVVVAIASQTARNATDLAQFNETFSARLQSLSATYGLLTKGNWESTPLTDLIEAVVTPHAGEDRLTADGPPVRLAPRAALALSMVLHELSTNAVKHGALGAPAGKLSVSWKPSRDETGQRIMLDWTESGMKIAGPPERRGFGVSLIETSVQHELGGRAEMNYKPAGLAVRIEFPQPYR